MGGPVSAAGNTLVSVVIPVYNRPQKILEAVQSVQAQTVSDWEMVLVDDGSKDDTPQVLRELEKRDRRIRAVFQENRGAQAARNAGIRAARGEWVAFLDSDDTWMSRSLELRLAKAAAEKISVVYSTGTIVLSDGTKEPYRPQGPSGYIYRDVLNSEGPMFQTLLVRKTALERIGLLDERIVSFQEWDTSIQLARHFHFSFIPEPTYVYDCRGTDVISKQFRRAAIGYEQVVRKNLWPMLLYLGPTGLARHCESAALWYEKAEDVAAARRCRLARRLWSGLSPTQYLRKIVSFFNKVKQGM